MTVADTAYTDLITSEHANQPKYIEMVGLTTQPMVDQQNVLASFVDKYDLDDAVGQQLDVLGRWIGVSRIVKVPLTGVYFSLDVVGVGLDESVWYETGMSLFTSVTLEDEPYRRLLKAKAVANRSDGSFNAVYDVYARYFLGTPNEVKIHDYQDMSYAVEVVGPVIDETTQAILQQDLFGVRPEGVRQLPLILP